MKLSAETLVSWAGGKALNIPLGNMVLFHDHPEGHNEIQDNYKSKLFVMESKHQDSNLYTIKPLNGKGPIPTVNQWQLFNLHKSQGNDMPSDPAPDTKLPTILTKKPMKNVTPEYSHLYGTRLKPK